MALTKTDQTVVISQESFFTNVEDSAGVDHTIEVDGTQKLTVVVPFG